MDYFDLGTFSRPASTSADAQLWFDRGMVWLFGYNHEEAVACFERALDADPTCAMAAWGVAYAIGPNYNKPWEFFEADEKALSLEKAHAALAQAQATEGLTAVETAMVKALADRYPTDPEIEDFAPWNDAFADAMRPVYAAHPDDLDVTSVFVEALMNRTPWALWDTVKGAPAEDASTEEAMAALSRAFETIPAAWDHPGLLHLWIHLMEMSPTPEVALRQGDRLTDLVPGSGHLIHMATHIDVLCGDYETVVRRNLAGAVQDRIWEEQHGAQNFYTVYRIHNMHFVVYGAMFLGQPEVALEAADELIRMLPEDTVRYLPELFESFHGKKVHVLVRFGMWQEILDMPFPEDADLYLYTTCALRQARAVALANLGRIEEARAEVKEADAALAKIPPEDHFVFNNPSVKVLEVGQAMMEGEIAYKAGDIDAGLTYLEEAIRLEDALIYDEPWGWMQPTRHALGALLMDAGRFEQAEAVYRADLGLDNTLPRPCQHPRNVWSLHGLHECLERRGEEVERRHIKLLLDQALARATVPIRASCYCRSKAA